MSPRSPSNQSRDREGAVWNGLVPHRAHLPAARRCDLPFGTAPRSRRRAFSLLEMMIAIVILGLGLIMVATMFPVAWTRARNMAEFTQQRTMTGHAETTLRAFARVDGLETVETLARRPGGTTFAGDLLFQPAEVANQLVNPTDGYLTMNPAWAGALHVYSDTRVHLLHMENMLVNRAAAASPKDVIIPEDPWRREGVRLHPDPNLNNPELSPTFNAVRTLAPWYAQSFLVPNISFEARFQPPLPRRESRDFKTDTPQTRLWDQQLDSRRFAWAILHRLRTRIGPEEHPDPVVNNSLYPFHTVEASAGVAQRREFDIFYVTLRRTQPTLRFAQQSKEGAPNPYLLPPPGADGANVQALPPDEDVVLPVPWRVQVYFPPNLPSNLPGSPNPPVGTATEIRVNPQEAPRVGRMEQGFVVDMFPVGATFIDELTGLVFRVAQRRVIPGASRAKDEAVLTLHREVLAEELDTGDPSFACDSCSPGVLDNPQETLRTVWVFPPPVLPKRDADQPVFEGDQPVVAIDTGTLFLAPPQ